MTQDTKKNSPVVLCIMDGWGHRPDSAHNAVALAQTPVFDHLMATCPHSFVAASGADVGLPAGQVGNSEVGHMNIGAGRVVMQTLPRISAAVADGSLANHPKLIALANQLIVTGGTAHVMGLLSDGGVHAHQDHTLCVIHALAARGVKVVVHAFTDGRDVLPKAAINTMPAFLDQLPETAIMASVIGRYYAMDRDHRWARTEAAFNAITYGNSINAPASDAMAAIQQAHDNGESDEFIVATVIEGYTGMKDGDGIVMMNFRADRVRQILDAFCRPDTVGFAAKPPRIAAAVGMSSYSEPLDEFVETLFPATELEDTLGTVVAAAGLRQLRLAETEKYPHVTFFFNGGEETTLPHEDRQMVPSPSVATYDMQPEMSAKGVLETALNSLSTHAHDLLIINFANPDMVGHTGDLAAAIQAVETVDECVGRLAEAVRAQNGQMLVTADHGNCEIMWDIEANSPHTAHTTNLVPLILVNGAAGTKLADGQLADLAPSLLAMLGISQPSAMTGNSLLRS
jgi:2,3-bisphosphoglycerate-independent phosphoglycerate mutase